MSPYQPDAPARGEIDALPGPTLLEFGANWCRHCQGAQAHIARALGEADAPPALRHLKIEDGPGRPLGRSFRVKLWPTLIVLKDGQEIARVVRPTGSAEINAALRQLAD